MKTRYGVVGLAVVALVAMMGVLACDITVTVTENDSASGRVVDRAVTTTGIAGVSVVLTPSTGTALTAVETDSTGNYRFPTVPNGTYTLSATKTGYTFEPIANVVIVQTPYTLPQLRGVSAVAATISGSVVDSESSTSAGITGVTVTVTPASGTATTATTGTDGAYSLTNLAHGTYTLSATKTGYTFTSIPDVVVKDGITTLPRITGYRSTATATGTVVDSRTTDAATLTGLDGVAVSIQLLGDNGAAASGVDAITATTNTTGTYTASLTREGTYSITATKTGYFFLPQTITVAGIAESLTLPRILGVQVESNSAISLILTWNNSYKDLDGALTFPEGTEGGTNGVGGRGVATSSTFNPLIDYVGQAGTSVGFGPSDSGTADRETISKPVGTAYNDPKLTSGYTVGQVLAQTNTNSAVQLHADRRNGNGPEVITIRTMPFFPESGLMTSSAFDATKFPLTGGSSTATGLPEKLTFNTTVGEETAKYAWIGVAQYYVDGYHSTDATATTRPGSVNDADHLITKPDGTGAGARLFVVQGSTLLGSFAVPASFSARTMSMLRINLFWAIASASTSRDAVYFQFVSDVRGPVNYGTQMRSLSGEVVADSEPVVFGAMLPSGR